MRGAVRSAAATIRLPRGPTFLGPRQRLVLALLVCLPVPALAGTGLAPPLPNVVYRVAVALAEQTHVVVVQLPGLGAIEETTAAPLGGTIKHTPAERAAARAAARQLGGRTTLRE